MSSRFLSSISFSFFFSWVFPHFFWLGVISLSPHFRRLFLFVSASQDIVLCLPVYMGWNSVVQVLWDSVTKSHLSPHLDALDLPITEFCGLSCCILALLVGVSFVVLICCLIWCVLPSRWLTDSHNCCCILYAVVQVLVNKAILPENQDHKIIKKISAISTSFEQRFNKVAERLRIL